MPAENIHLCPGCGAGVAITGVRVFAPVSCPACGTMFRIRDEVAGYQLGAPHARGALGMIFRTPHSIDGREVALKIIRAPSCAEPEDLERFVAATRTAAALRHSHCVRIFEAGAGEGFAWVAMEFLAGGSLGDLVARGVLLSEKDTLSIALAAASALAAAEAASLTHLDIEPGNLVFDQAGAIKVTDFGQFAMFERISAEMECVTGRPAFVAPERLAQAEEDAATDIYALGATLFYTLTGSPPYDGEAHGQILLDRMSSEAVRIEDHAGGISSATAATLNRMLAPSRERRFQTWQEVIAELTAARRAG